MAESLTGGDPKILAEFLKDGHALLVDGGYTAH